MTKNSAGRLPSAYEIRIVGNLDNRWSQWFEGWDLSPKDDGTTLLRGQVTDQAELSGLLAKIQNLNLPLISVNPALPRDTKRTRDI